jgi:hypothetical protein
MQTFLPYKSFKKSAKALDNRRLGKQRVETLQILKALSIDSYGWKNHPAVKMWKGYEPALIEYGTEICNEWLLRGFKDTCKEKIRAFSNNQSIIYPEWITSDFITTHRSNLIRKAPEYYQKLWPGIPSNLEYIWPTRQ